MKIDTTTELRDPKGREIYDMHHGAEPPKAKPKRKRKKK